jgi:glycosyltransferase involved in cell wall biosynthesis
MVGAIDDTLIRQIAPILEAGVVLSTRIELLGLVNGPLIRTRDSVFDRRMAAQLLASDAGFVGAYSASLQSLRRAKHLGVRSYLEYPIAHHAFAASLLKEEAGRRPEYADDLRLHLPSAALTGQLDAELELADQVFVLSSFQRRTFLEEGVPERKLMLTPLGVDLELFQPRRTALPRGPSTFRVLFVGQVTQRKGISYLFDAFRLAAIPGSELLLVGRPLGSYRGWRGLPGVRHINHVPRWQLPEVYATADVFVLPSLVEGFPQTALEAMACGLPVVVSENTFGHDVVTDGLEGYVVPIRDPEAIAFRLRYLHQNAEERVRMGQAARRRAERFSWDSYGRLVVQVIARSLESGPRGHTRSDTDSESL